MCKTAAVVLPIRMNYAGDVCFHVSKLRNKIRVGRIIVCFKMGKSEADAISFLTLSSVTACFFSPAVSMTAALVLPIRMHCTLQVCLHVSR